jgi:hypothetical protein
MNNLGLYSSQNLYEGAFLLCRGFKLAGKQMDGQKVTLVFEGKDVQKEALSFYNGAKVEAKALTDAYRSLKDFVFRR